MKDFEFPNLETERLRLRAMGSDDVDFVQRHFGDAEVCRYLKDAPPVTTRAEAEAIVAAFAPESARLQNRWVLVRRESGEPIGTVGYHHWYRAYHRSEIGYDLTASAWGQGFMREALTAVIAFGFGPMELNRIEALVHPGNAASLGLLERFRFQREGLLRDLFYLDGVYYDHVLLSLLEREWRWIER